MASFLLMKNQEVLKIVDLALEIGKDGDGGHSLFSFDSSPLESSCLPPSLNEVTTYSSDQDESSDASISSMSSIGSGEIDFSESPRRTLFPSYWKRTGGAQRTPRLTTASFSKERSFEKAIISKVEEQHPSSSRRRIFNSFVSESTPSLSLVSLQYEGLRKAYSTTALRRKPSCLRQSRFSCAGRPRSKSCSDVPSVSFSTKVDIMIFDNPKELWSPEGWNQYFAI